MKLTNSLVAIAALSTLSFAGGDINPVTVFEQEPVVVPVEPVVVPKPAPAPIPAPVVVAPAAKDFYVALGATRLRFAVDAGDFGGLVDESAHGYETALTARLGYDFMNYLGAELRGTAQVSKADDGEPKYKQYGAYLKPNIDVTDALNLYGLVGVSKANLATQDLNKKETGLSYGLGVDYGISDSFSVFADVMDYMKKSNTVDQYGATLGAAFHF